MATRTAIASGSWSNPAIWDGGVSIPTLGDDVNASNFVVSVDQQINVGSLYSTGSGYFNPTSACTSITCTGVGIVVATWSGSGSFGLINLNGGFTMTITSNIYGGTAANGFGIFVQGSSNLTIVGNIYGGSNASGYGINNTAGGTMNITGNIQGGIAPAFRNTLATTITLTGNTTGGNAAGGFGLSNTGAGTTNITGNCTGGLANGFLTTGTTASTALTCVGTITASESASGLKTAGAVTVSTPCIDSYQFNAIDSVHTRIYASSACIWSFRTENDYTGYKRIYCTNYAPNNPTIANVRNGTSYAFGVSTGTLIVPSVANVQAGVAVDNTVGTYYKTASDVATEVFTELLSSGDFNTAGSFGKLIKDNVPLIPATV